MKHESTNEPVAWMNPLWSEGLSGFQTITSVIRDDWIPLYTHPQDQKKDEALRLALEALQLMYACYKNPQWISYKQHEQQILEQTADTITLIEQALENK